MFLLTCHVIHSFIHMSHPLFETKLRHCQHTYLCYNLRKFGLGFHDPLMLIVLTNNSYLKIEILHTDKSMLYSVHMLLQIKTM